jgi:hypothetical protein
VNLLHAFHEAGVIKKCCSDTGAWKQEKKPLEMVIYEFFYLQIRKCVISLKNSNQSLLIKLTTIISFFFFLTGVGGNVKWFCSLIPVRAVVMLYLLKSLK